MRLAFDADALIYAAEPGHPLGERVRDSLSRPAVDACASVIAVPEILIKPFRRGWHDEQSALESLLARLTLVPISVAVAAHAVTLGARYALSTPDALHLACACHAGADAFVTTNSRDFGDAIVEVTVVSPAGLTALLDPPAG